MATKKKKEKKKAKKSKKIKKVDPIEEFVSTDSMLDSATEWLDGVAEGNHLLPLSCLTQPEVRIVVAVAETGTWWDMKGYDKRKSFKLPCGMMGAQAAHAVSKLKLSYAQSLLENKSRQTEDFTDFEILSRLQGEGITTITLKARNSEELQHIRRLAIDKDLHYADFIDDNDKLYGPMARVLTAVAIGPILPADLEGITDYLPKWTCVCER